MYNLDENQRAKIMIEVLEEGWHLEDEELHDYLIPDWNGEIDTERIISISKEYIDKNYTPCKFRHAHHAIVTEYLVHDSMMDLIKTIDHNCDSDDLYLEMLYQDFDFDKIFKVARYSNLTKDALMYEISID